MFYVYKRNRDTTPELEEIGRYPTARALTSELEISQSELYRAMDGKHPRYVVEFDAEDVVSERGSVPIREIADILGVSPSAINNTLITIRKKLLLSNRLRELLREVAADKGSLPIEVRYHVSYTLKRGGNNAEN
jgi:hypothetical protein